MNDKSSKYKLIAAGITLLLGLILAIGYPTGGVKANKIQQKQIVQRTTVQHNTDTIRHVNIKKDKSKKKRVIPVPPPSTSNEESQDEGC